MVNNTTSDTLDMNRRRVLQGLGAAGIVGVAGCLGEDDESDISFPLEIQLETNADNDDRVQLVELIAETMQQTGYFETSVETYDWDTYLDRILDTEYAQRGHIPCVGLSGTYNPESFCQALHHSRNHGACCNLTGVSFDHLDEMLDGARYDMEAIEDPDERRRRYDEIWHELADLRASSITHFGLNSAVMNTSVHGFVSSPFNETMLSTALHSPSSEVVTWIDDSGAHPEDTDLSDLQEGGTLRVGMTETPPSFDPPFSADTTASMAQNYIFEGLTTGDLEGNVYPWLAESYELLETNDISPVDYEDYMITASADEEGAIDTDEQVLIVHPDDDPVGDDEVRILVHEGAGDAIEDGVFGMQFRYHLHEGIEFTDGEELTAENVVMSARRYENSLVAAQTFDSLLYADEVDTYTVDLYAQVPDAEAERELPGFSIHSTEQAALAGGDLDPRQGNTPIGTGPYVLDEFEEGSYMEFSKNENYWVEQKGLDALEWWDGPSEFPAAPVIDEIECEFIPENATRAAALQSDEIDVTYGLSSGVLDDFDASDDYYVASVEAGGYTYIQYPLHVDPWDDNRLRQAVNHLVPRQQIVDNVLNGWGRPAWTDIPSLAQGTGSADAEALEEEIRPTNEYDPDRAVELIEEVIEDHGYSSDV